MNIPPFECRYVPDIYLTWELEPEQRFTCLQYPEERRVAAIVCHFTSFACVWWSEHCRLYPIPATWAALKTAMRTHWVPPYYQRESKILSWEQFLHSYITQGKSLQNQ